MAQPEPTSRCGACGESDNEPKHDVLVGFNNEHTGGVMFHEHDDDRDGVIHYHFHCPSEWHGRVEDPTHARICAVAASGVRGEKLRARIVKGDV